MKGALTRGVYPSASAFHPSFFSLHPYHFSPASFPLAVVFRRMMLVLLAM